MKEKTRLLFALTAIFVIAMIIIAFGSFLEETPKDKIAPNTTSIKIPKEKMGSLSLQKEGNQNEFIEDKLK